MKAGKRGRPLRKGATQSEPGPVLMNIGPGSKMGRLGRSVGRNDPNNSRDAGLRGYEVVPSDFSDFRP